MRRTGLVLLVASAVLLAGCSGGSGDADGGSSPDPSSGSAGAGRVVGTVTDDEIRPLAGALASIALANGTLLTDTTDTAGFFRLGPVPTGRHILVVEADGFAPVDRQVFVLPGQEVEASFELARIASMKPYVLTETFEGQYQCASSSPAGSGSCDAGQGFLETRANHSYRVPADWGGLLLEVVWSSGTPTATVQGMTLVVGSFETNLTFLEATAPASPLRAVLTAGQVHPNATMESPIPPDGQRVWVFLRPGNATVAVDLSYEIYMTAFVRQPVAEGYSALPDA